MKEKLNALLEQLGSIYEESDIKRLCEKERQEWGYSLVTTAMERSTPLILGFNWGATQNEKYPIKNSWMQPTLRKRM